MNEFITCVHEHRYLDTRLHNKQKEDMKAGKLCVGRDGKDLKGGNGGSYDYDSGIHMQNY